ncbi:hypothetical protein BUALT_Bualt09G0103400 [Buddleja alternifolia]|uniref:DUF7138 domain-containing protein n=1 Tax=Buddleja alternifolia TaxID=168488 RepID=A0AAV6X2V8_9LAMI|nr:hypothetical protein BUALT_Bualt09G0103400 [Buddleja alternifolia]
MVEGGGGPAFPVLFFDGEREMNIGDVKINPTLEYKPFQLMLSQKIGISPNQISIYLVDRRKHASPPFSEERRRIPITGKVNFGLICRQKDCCFLVVLKRSRKSRNRRERMISGVEFSDFLPENEFTPPPMHTMPENLILLRRNQQLPFYDQITQSGLADLNDRLQNLRVQRENYQFAMAKGNLNSPNYSPGGHGLEPRWSPNLDVDLIPNIDGSFPVVPSPTMMMTKTESKKPFCGECVNAMKNGSATTSFHHCVNDARFKPPVCYGTHDLCDCGTRSRRTGFSPVHQVPRLNPVQAQVESFMGERAWGLLHLQRELWNRIYLNRVLPGGGLGMMSSAHGGTGVFLPRTPNNNMQPPRNHTHSCVRKGHRMMSKHDIQLPPRKILLNRRREETR